jgi:opacity protein-like surface antigen
VILLALSANARAGNSALEETLSLRAGPFLANLDATVKSRGLDFSFDESLDTDDIDLSLYGLWRITPRLRFEAGYSGIDKSTTETLSTSITTDFVSIPAGSSATGSLETSVLRLALGYAFWRQDKFEFGVDLGVNLTSVKETVRATIPGSAAIDLNFIDVDEPLPTIGLFFNYAFSDAWYVTSRAGLFALEIGDIDGTVYDIFGGIEYRIWPQVGLGLAYTYTNADLTISSKGSTTDVEYSYHGPYLYLVVGF